jgi:hypothetical protein
MQRAGLGVADDGCYDECHCLHLHHPHYREQELICELNVFESDATLEMVSVLHTALMHVCLHPPRAQAQYILTLRDKSKSHVRPCMYINQYACLHIRTAQPHAASRSPLLAPTSRAFPIHIPTLRGLPALLRRCLLLLVERVQVGGRKAKRRQDLVQLALEVGQVRLERAGGLFASVFWAGWV